MRLLPLAGHGDRMSSNSSKPKKSPGVVQHRLQSQAFDDPDVIERTFRVVTHWLSTSADGDRQTFEQAIIDEFGGEKVYFPAMARAARLEEESRARVLRDQQAARVAEMRSRGCSFTEIARVERISRGAAHAIASRIADAA